jgi:Spy/CpxP family protein refolding chaperone
MRRHASEGDDARRADRRSLRARRVFHPGAHSIGGAFADALAGDTFDDATATAAAKRRAESAERVANAVLEALRQIHALLEPEQREIFAYLTRSGALEL